MALIDATSPDYRDGRAIAAEVVPAANPTRIAG
jgi:hypothetical protein